MSLRRCLLKAVLAGACATLATATTASTASAAGSLYLALGDSVPVWDGTQSYPNLVQAHIAHRIRGLALQNLAISGETTGSMLSGQYGRALATLRSDRGHVALITIDIGGNDVVPCALGDYPSPGPGSAACWANNTSTMSSNLTRILQGLRSAAPGVPIIGMTYYNPLLGNWLAGGTIRSTVVTEQTHLVDLNTRLIALYGGARWTADVESAFHARDLTTIVSSPWGRIPIGVARACSWLDISCHVGSLEGFGDDPNPQGAAVIAGAFNQRLDSLCRLSGAARRWLLCGRPAPPPPPTVHVRGTAYEFNNVHTLLAGATVHVAEFPDRTATVGVDGRYDLTVPDHARVTPYIVAPGYHTIYLQTFTTNGENLENVNFQTPTEPVYRGLVALLSVPVDANGNPVRCAIVSTFNTRNVRDLPFADFIAYGAHGVAGATASTTPALPTPIYFNKNVVPDPHQVRSSEDGGVVWTNVPAGVYTVTAHSATTRFASFVASCRPGRVINANPPWGLHELGLPNPARATATWSAHAVLGSLRVTRLPATQPRVTVRCTGRGCRLRERTYSVSSAAFNVRRAVGAFVLRAGQTLEVSVTAHRYNGVVWRWRFRPGRAPAQSTLCVPLGDALALAYCPSS